jgi:hypothetical protein
MIFIVGEDLVKKMFYSKYNLKKKIKIFFFYLKKNKMLVILVIDESIVQFIVVVAVIVTAVVDFRVSTLAACCTHYPRIETRWENLLKPHHGQLQTQLVLFVVYFVSANYTINYLEKSIVFKMIHNFSIKGLYFSNSNFISLENLVSTYDTTLYQRVLLLFAPY